MSDKHLIYKEQTGVNYSELNNGISYLKYALSNGILVIVGINNKIGTSNPATDNTTDHFIVLVGMGQDSLGKYFSFYDNASGYPIQGASTFNKLYYNSISGKISGQSVTDYAQTPPHHEYIITQIRKSKIK
ncbi:hypothetical protein [Epilithonimonas caeni]|uniref:hypothetical protein n=1 Tax=Epilithonimonas caeni TaxID=365343 RepID=UPI0012EC559E|nr:hypothetical protein [Epilithonimonas caeni]